MKTARSSFFFGFNALYFLSWTPKKLENPDFLVAAPGPCDLLRGIFGVHNETGLLNSAGGIKPQFMATKQEQRFGAYFVWFWGHHFQTNPKIGVIYYDRRVVNGVIDCKWVYEWGYLNFVVDEMVNISAPTKYMHWQYFQPAPVRCLVF